MWSWFWIRIAVRLGIAVRHWLIIKIVIARVEAVEVKWWERYKFREWWEITGLCGIRNTGCEIIFCEDAPVYRPSTTFLKADMIVDGWKDPSLPCMYSLTKSSFGISDPVSSTMESHRSSQARWNGPKTPTSRGCNMWVVWGGRHKIMILWSSVRWMISEVSWELWPSRIRRIGFPDFSHAVACGINDFSNHSAPIKSSIQPFWDLARLNLSVKICNKKKESFTCTQCLNGSQTTQD